MKNKNLSLFAAAAVVIGLTTFVMWPRTKAQPDGEKNYAFMHCETCDREWRYSATAFESGCLLCEGKLTGTKDSTTGAKKPPSPYTKVFLAVYAEVLAVLAAVWFMTKPREANQEIAYLYLRCAKCRQKLRYQERQIGNKGACPRCQQLFVFPHPGPDDDDDEG